MFAPIEYATVHFRNENQADVCLPYDQNADGLWSYGLDENWVYFSNDTLGMLAFPRDVVLYIEVKEVPVVPKA